MNQIDRKRLAIRAKYRQQKKERTRCQIKVKQDLEREPAGMTMAPAFYMIAAAPVMNFIVLSF